MQLKRNFHHVARGRNGRGTGPEANTLSFGTSGPPISWGGSDPLHLAAGNGASRRRSNLVRRRSSEWSIGVPTVPVVLLASYSHEIVEVEVTKVTTS